MAKKQPKPKKFMKAQPSPAATTTALVLPAEDITKHHRFDYSVNHQKIEDFLYDYLQKQKRMPTQGEIAEGTGISREAVNRHMKEFKFSNFKPQYKPLTGKVMLGLLSACMAGSAFAIRLWFQLVEGVEVGRPSDDGDPEMNEKAEIIKTLLRMTPEQRAQRLLQLRARHGITIPGS